MTTPPLFVDYAKQLSLTGTPLQGKILIYLKTLDLDLDKHKYEFIIIRNSTQFQTKFVHIRGWCGGPKHTIILLYEIPASRMGLVHVQCTFYEFYDLVVI